MTVMFVDVVLADCQMILAFPRKGIAFSWPSWPNFGRTLTTTIYSGISIFTWLYLQHKKKNEKENVRVKQKIVSKRH
jgi:hypothetical protein